MHFVQLARSQSDGFHAVIPLDEFVSRFCYVDVTNPCLIAAIVRKDPAAIQEMISAIIQKVFGPGAGGAPAGSVESIVTGKDNIYCRNSATVAALENARGLVIFNSIFHAANMDYPPTIWP